MYINSISTNKETNLGKNSLNLLLYLKMQKFLPVMNTVKKLICVDT